MLEVLELACCVITLATSRLERTNYLDRVDLVSIRQRLEPAGNGVQKLWVISVVLEDSQWAHVGGELDRHCWLRHLQHITSNSRLSYVPDRRLLVQSAGVAGRAQGVQLRPRQALYRQRHPLRHCTHFPRQE